MSNKVLFIGLDSAEPDLIDHWIDQGQLPNLARLKGQGRWGRLQVPAGFSHKTAWVSLYTGVHPGEHGALYGTRMRPGSYDQRAYDLDAEMTCIPVWQAVGVAGHRAVVVDVPKACFSPPPGGVQITNWRTHGFNPPVRSAPPEVADTLIQRFGPDPLGEDRNLGGSRVRDFAHFQEALLARIRHKLAWALDCLQAEHPAEQPELFMVCFGEPHDIGHHGWHLHDQRHAEHDAAWVRRHGDPFFNLYAALDDAVGRLRDAAGEDTVVMCFAGPGMQPLVTGNHLLDPILRRLSGQRGSSRARMFERLQGLARLVVPPGLRYRISKRREVMGLLADRSTRPCFTVASNTDNGAIRVNLEGREPQGIIAPQDMDAYCTRLGEQLLDLRDADTGAPAVREVIRFAERYPGKEVARSAPDLLVVWNRDTPLRAVTSPATGRVARRLCDVRTGDHSTNTLFMAAGPGITLGELEAGYRVESIAPTLAACFGVAMPGAQQAPLPLRAAG